MTESNRPRLIVFTRYPTPGRVKSRIAAGLGDEAAADLHRAMTEHVVRIARDAAIQSGADLEVRIDGGSPNAVRAWLGADLDCRPQEGDTLGERMERALADALAEGSRRAVLFGTDVPDLSPAILAGALAALTDHDAVIGPALDGGYYLIGLARPAPALFSEIEWGATDVCARTLAAADDAGLSAAVLPALADVDRPEDLAVWERVRRDHF